MCGEFNPVYSRRSNPTDTKTRKANLISVIQRKAGEKEKVIELVEMYKLLIDNLSNASVIK